MMASPNQAQNRAADPGSSIWLSANAGSGKTKVLIDRVARLLLAGVAPPHILCLTYTKAAATEMQNRLFARLGGWAMMPQADLRRALQDLGDTRAQSQGDLARARQLFARAIESPGGLRIQTIHSFCATLLRRFPLEAGVSPIFQEMDDRAARLMREAIIEDMAETIAPDVVRDLAQYHSGADFLQLMNQLARHALDFTPPLDEAAAKTLFGLTAHTTAESLTALVFLGGEADLLADLIPRLQASGANDQKAADRLAAIDMGAQDLAALSGLEDVFLYGKTAKSPFAAKLDTFPTKDVRNSLPAHIRAQLDALMQRIEAARPTRLALLAARKTAALHRFAGVFLPLYDQAKAARGVLDFDDLITKAVHLLSNPSVAAWVLFRLDGGIDHILVDEAQDTSPKQWRVIELLSQEFTAGQGAHDTPRSLFVVGDKKQSIYSFQGADIAVFDDKHAQFKQRFAAAQLPMQDVALQYSFRSSPAVLRVVDMVFGTRFARAMGDQVSHIAHHADMAGRVDLWPAFAADKDETQIDPVDTTARLSTETAPWKMAQALAAHIAQILASGMAIPTKDGVRPVQAGDILILVRRRGDVFHAILRACKRLGLPIAGADRLRLGAELAVRDLTAVLQFLATPEDDLSLAAALRSPLLGLDEGQLFDLAHGRAGYLWERLRASDLGDVLDILHDLRNSADYLRPYELLERLLTRHDGRRNLVARLGPEAEEGIDELLSQALAYEMGEIPSLTGFLLWLGGDDIDIKRQPDSAGALIRVMTVHGAKGLESPIVILPETADYRPQDRDLVVMLPGGTPAWRMNADECPPLFAAASAQGAASEQDESLRLLYVALTRAQSWLIVAAAGKTETKGEGKLPSWYGLIEQGIRAAGCVPVTGGVLRHEFGTWPDAVAAGAPRAPAPPPHEALPDWAKSRAPNAPRPPAPFAPSRLSGEKTLPGEAAGNPDALDYGRAVHLLLEVLPDAPPSDWPRLAAHLAPAHAQPALAEAQRVLTHPDLLPLFHGTLAEVPLTAPLDKGRMLGVIDRLILRENHVLAVDFKTNAIVPASPADVPAGLLAQMGAYAAALAQIYPAAQVDVAILWTKTAQLMVLDPDRMRSALADAAIS